MDTTTYSNEFESAFGLSAFLPNGGGALANVPVNANQFIEVGRVVVPSGTAYDLGVGDLKSQADAIGRIFADLRDTTVAPGAKIDGIVRIDLHDPQNRVLRTVYQGRTEMLRTSQGDRRQQYPFSKRNVRAGWNYAFVLKVMPDAGAVGNGTLAWTAGGNTAFMLNVTTWDTAKVTG